jgi:hypothetical protein
MALREILIEAAKKNLVNDGALHPVFFLCRGEQMVMPPTLMSSFDRILGDLSDMDEWKTRAVYLIGGMARVMNADRVILIWDAAFRTFEGVAPEDRRAIEGDPTERPLLYPKSMRTECIIFEDITLPSGEDYTGVIPYKGGDGVPVEFITDGILAEAMANGKYESRFPEVLLSGYNKAAS